MHTFYYNISDFEKTKVIEPVSSVISRHHIQAPVYDKHNILIGELSSINHHKIIDGKNTITTQTYLKTNKGVLGFSVFYETSNIIELYLIGETTAIPTIALGKYKDKKLLITINGNKNGVRILTVTKNK